MVQRIQSVFFLISAIVGVLLFLIPLSEYHSGDGTFTVYGCRTLDEAGELVRINYELIAELLLVVLFNLIAIFSYKKRGRQMQLGKLSILIGVLFLVNALLYAEYVELPWKGDDKMFIAQIGTYIAIIPLVTSYLAVRYVKKDDDLVKAADRLR